MNDDDYEDGHAIYYPGNRQMYCIICHEPTEQLEDGALYVNDKGPLCDSCFTDECDARNQEGLLNFS
jgi:hypothetical protein